MYSRYGSILLYPDWFSGVHPGVWVPDEMDMGDGEVIIIGWSYDYYVSGPFDTADEARQWYAEHPDAFPEV